MALNRIPSPSSLERKHKLTYYDYVKLKLDVANELTLMDVSKLSALFNLSKADSAMIRHSNAPGLELLVTLETQGVISSDDMSKLMDALQICNLGGVADKIQQVYPTTKSYHSVSKDYGKLKVDVANHLSLRHVIMLSTFFNLSKGVSDKIFHSDTPGLELAHALEAQGVISSDDISQLIDGLQKCDLGGVADAIQQKYLSNKPYHPVPKDYGKLKVDVAELLTPHEVNKLSTFFNLSKAVSDKIFHSDTPGFELVSTLETQGVISSDDISQLIDGLQKCNLGGVADAIQQEYLSNKPYHAVPKGTKQAFINHLKMSYEILCHEVKPVPVIQSKLYCISDIYVQGGMEVLVRSGVDEKSNIWSPLESHHEILMNNPKTKSKRKIIEGDPGYGKSTLLLQYLHDWCSGNPKSTLKDTEIVIYLKFHHLKRITSIYEAIKLTLLPRYSTITEYDIENIIQSCKSVVIFLDGYDEYPDTDFFHIMGMEMFYNSDVIITTRISNLPPNTTTKAKRIRLTGFGKQNRENYILKVVAPGNLKAANMIETQLERNSLLGDLCESPLFFTMVAHIAHEREDLEIFRTATRLFRFIEECFHSHMRNKGLGVTDDMIRKFQTEHSELDRLAFEGLCGQQHQQLSWRRPIMVGRVGPEFLNYYVHMGMLVEEEVFDVSRRFDVLWFMRRFMALGFRFPHKIFYEYYASFYLAAQIESGTAVEYILSQVNPLDQQYLYRFTCGLSKTASEHVIKYLQKTRDGQRFAVLCMFEQAENSEQFLQIVTDLVSGNSTMISETDTKLLQRSTIQILHIASANEIPITDLNLLGSFSNIHDGNVMLKSGLRLRSLTSLEKITIDGARHKTELSEDFVNGLLNYGLQSERFKELLFCNCGLPKWMRFDVIPQSRNIKVTRLNDANELESLSDKWTKSGIFQNDFEEFKRSLAEILSSDECQLIGNLFQLSKEQQDVIVNNQDRAMMVEMVVKKTGEVLSIPGTGVRLEIPPGALPEEQLIKMRIITRYQDQSTLTFASNTSPVIELLPNNLKLRQPALLTLPHCLVLKKGVKWKAKIYSSHHDEGEKPLWVKQPSTKYTLSQQDCTISLQSFCWEMMKIGRKYVEGKRIMMYAAKAPDWTIINVGYYLDLPQCEELTSVNEICFLHRKRAVLLKKGKKPLRIYFERTTSPSLHHDPEDKNPKKIPFKNIAFHQESFCTFMFTENDNLKDGCRSKCVFKFGQFKDLEDFIFSRKENASVGSSIEPVTTEVSPPQEASESSTSSKGYASVAGSSVESTQKVDGSLCKVPKLDRPVDDETLMDIKGKMEHEWKDMGRYLKVGDELKQLAMNNKDSISETIYKMLITWRQKNGKAATFRVLGTALDKVGRRDLQEIVYERALLKTSEALD